MFDSHGQCRLGRKGIAAFTVGIVPTNLSRPAHNAI
jgi:hypothetical protein